MTTPDEPRPERPSPTDSTEDVYVNPAYVVAGILLVLGLVLGLVAADLVWGRVGVLTTGAVWCTLLGLILGATGGDRNGST